jgi:hypothetical protein
LHALPERLETLNSFAFNKCGAGIKINALPPTLKTVGIYVFNGCPNINIIDFGSDEEGSGLIHIASNAFNNSGTNISG